MLICNLIIAGLKVHYDSITTTRILEKDTKYVVTPGFLVRDTGSPAHEPEEFSATEVIVSASKHGRGLMKKSRIADGGCQRDRAAAR